MADDVTTPTSTTPTDPTATVDGTQPDELGEAGKKALAQERAAKKAAEKQVSDLSRRLQEIEDRDKTEAQKLADRATAAEKAAQDAQIELIRMRIIAEVQLDHDLHEFVTGNTEDDIRAKAEKLKARSAGDTSATQPAPRPDLSQGARSAMPLNGDPLLNALERAIGAR